MVQCEVTVTLGPYIRGSIHEDAEGKEEATDAGNSHKDNEGSNGGL